ncbi:MAG TPA: iron ABC transporter permease [Aestuariivirga sp.]|nr:iron ABC transporter permease [Hyphomicrobiales bacterium]HQY73868.1 iron ABC transporter permease [Aestuariivirga sp.]HRA93050.1 iron ABC transporter permease [Aestuariivirga sp.]
MAAVSTRAKSRASPAETWLMLGACLIALLVTLPILTIVLLSFTSGENIWPHLLGTVLPGYVWRTLGLLAGVGFLTFIIGTATAWLVSMHDFPLRRILQWACLMPLAMPTYIVSYTYVDFLNYAGPLQTWLRGAMGWSRPDDYMFPEIRSLSGAVLVLALVLYPYVFMTAQASFLRQPMSQMDVARTLGKTPWGAFLSVALPQARPAIVVGVSLALMECLNDIAAVGFFGVNTLTLGIYTTWLGEGNLGGAAQLAVALLIFVFALLWVERHARKRQSTMPGSRHPMAPRRTALAGWRGILAMLACIVPVFLGFILPALILLKFAARHFEDILSPSYFNAMWHSFTLSLTASLVVVVLGLILAYAYRSQSGRKISNLLRLASVGYAMPGTVLGIGVLIPLAYFDNSVDAFMRSSFGVSTGLLLSGTITAIIFAYAIRFLAISFGSLESGLEKVTPNLTFAARTLGRTPLRTVLEIHLPILRPALVTATLLVFVDCMKELPATLILRPFDFETLATLVYLLASLGQLEESAAPALTIVAAGLIPIILLTRNLRIRESFR